MKVFALNVSRSHGISMKKDPKGKDYDIGTMQILVPFENVINSTPKTGGVYSVEGFGYTAAEMPMRTDCVDQFKDIEFPAMIEVATDSEVMFGRMTTVVSGLIVSGVKPAKAA